MQIVSYFITHSLRFSTFTSLLHSVRVMAAVEQFREGMGDLWDLVIGHPDTFRPVFVSDQQNLTFLSFRSLYDVDYADQHTRRRDEENETMYQWDLFLQDCFGNFSCYIFTFFYQCYVINFPSRMV